MVFCAKQAAAELRGATTCSASMIESLGSAKRLQAGETDLANQKQIHATLSAAQEDAALHRKVSRALLARYVFHHA